MKLIQKCKTNEGEAIWFPADNINLLCQQIDNRAICKAVLPDYDKKIQLYQAIYEYNHNLYLVPWRARWITVYDIQKEKYYFLENDELKLWREIECKYAASMNYKECLYLFGKYIPYIVKINMCTNQIEMFNKITESHINFLKDIKTTSGLIFSQDYEIDNESVWIPLAGTKAILQFQLEGNFMRLYELPISCCTICKADEKGDFWIYSINYDCIAKWNYEKGIKNVFHSINLHHVCGEASIEFQNKIIKCKSSVEYVSINIENGQRIKDQIYESDILFDGCACDDKILYEYLKGMKKQLLREESLADLDNPLNTFLKYINKIEQNESDLTGGTNNGKAICKYCNDCI